MVRLLARETELDLESTSPPLLPDNVEMGRAIGCAVGRPDLPVRLPPWWAMTLASPS